MLIRFVVENLFSFGKEVSFDMLPGRSTRLKHHKVEIGEVSVLRMAGLYGANGSGKSNLLKALSILKRTITHEGLPNTLRTKKFKLCKENESRPVRFGIEFSIDDIIYYYSICINHGVVLEEELSFSGGREGDDIPIFIRIVEEEKHTIKMVGDLEGVKEGRDSFVDILNKNFIKPDRPFMLIVKDFDGNEFLPDVIKARKWFTDVLHIIFPTTHPRGIVHRIDMDGSFEKFANDVMSGFNTGVERILSEKMPIERFFGEDNRKDIDEVMAEMERDSDVVIGYERNGEEYVVYKDNDGVYAKRIVFRHSDTDGSSVHMSVRDESDGTQRLLEYIPALYDLLHKKQVFLFDEIERSLHPNLIKTIVAKISESIEFNGQLIFTTHETNLLDQDILRQDEVWFVEKSPKGYTEMYSLAEFSEHHTIDIEKGYVNGRYGAIPFTTALKNLKWD